METQKRIVEREIKELIVRNAAIALSEIGKPEGVKDVEDHVAKRIGDERMANLVEFTARKRIGVPDLVRAGIDIGRRIGGETKANRDARHMAELGTSATAAQPAFILPFEFLEP